MRESHLPSPRRSGRGPRALGVGLAVLAVLGAAPAHAQAPGGPPAPQACPTFRVLHDDPPAGYRAGTYDMQVWGTTTCRRAVGIFQRFLSNPRSLPRGWFHSATQAGFVQGRAGRNGFSLSLRRSPHTPHANGVVTACPRLVELTTPSPASSFEPGRYQLQVFGVARCDEARAVFEDWLLDPDVTELPEGWVPLADTPGFFFLRGAGGGFHVFRV